MKSKFKSNDLSLKNLLVIVSPAPITALPGCKLLHIPEIFRYLIELFGASMSVNFFSPSSQKLSGSVIGTKQPSNVSPKSRKVEPSGLSGKTLMKSRKLVL